MTIPSPEEAAKVIAEIHDKACAEGSDTYNDPFTDETVFTRLYLTNRGWCCQQGCRHCPYGDVHITVRYKTPPAG